MIYLLLFCKQNITKIEWIILYIIFYIGLDKSEHKTINNNNLYLLAHLFKIFYKYV